MRCLGAAKIRDPNHTNEQSLRHCSMFEYLPKALTILAPASALKAYWGRIFGDLSGTFAQLYLRLLGKYLCFVLAIDCVEVVPIRENSRSVPGDLIPYKI
jgi:hypothetical protein